jgi:hypothetical protein
LGAFSSHAPILPYLPKDDKNYIPIIIAIWYYTFEVAFTVQKGPRGATVLKTGEAVTARWRDIIVLVPPEATQFAIVADGRQFVLEAKYTEAPTIEGVLPREVVTSFGQMFTGGRIGISAMLGNG